MDTAELIQEISVKDVDVDRFVQLAIDDGRIRDEGVDVFIRAGVSSISPKTRRRANALVRKYGL